MKVYILFLALIFLFFGPLNAQTSITSQVFPMAGDTLDYAVDNQPGIQVTASGGGQVWDYSSLGRELFFQQIYEVPDSGAGFSSFPEATLLSRLTQGVESYWQVSEDNVELIGAYGEDPIGLGLLFSTRFIPPLIEITTPLNYLDTLKSNTSVLLPFATSDLPDTIVAQLPIRPDSFRIRTVISRVDIADAWGTLQLPETSYEVLRQKRVETANFRIEAKILFLGWQDITDLLSSFFMGQDLPRDTLISYRFLSNEVKDPVLICTMDSIGVNIVSAQYRSSPLSTSISEASPFVSSLTIFPNPVTDRIHFSMEEMPAGKHMLQIFNANGLLVKEGRFLFNGTVQTESMDVSDLEPGAYWGVWKNDHTGKILTRPVLIIKQ